jgi:hypothetical protein
MPELTPQSRRQETAETTRLVRDLAVDYAGYFGVHVAGRTGKYPSMSDGVKLLDAHIERAFDIKRGFASQLPVERDKDDEQIDAERNRAWKRMIESEGEERVATLQWFRRFERGGLTPWTAVPPDYTFVSVRHPVARSLLDLINISMAVDDTTAENAQERARKLGANGKEMVRLLVNDDPKALARITDVQVLEAVFGGILRLPSVPGKAPDHSESSE